MRRGRGFWAILSVIVLLVGVAVVTNGGARTAATLPEPGYRAPDFRLTSFAGQSISLSQFHGKLVFVNFWASWCPPCQAESPDLVKMYQKYGKQITFIGVNLTGSDTVRAARGFIQHFYIPYPSLMDTHDAVTKEYAVIAIPTSLFINRQGIIVSRVTGGMTAAIMQANFNKLLAQS